jgi:hypothetical protein
LQRRARRYARRDQRANLLKRRFQFSPALSSVFQTHLFWIVLIARDDRSATIAGSRSFARCTGGVGATAAGCGFFFLGSAGTAFATLAGRRTRRVLVDSALAGGAFIA